MLDIKELEQIHMRASVAGDMLVSIAALGNAIDIMNQQAAEIARLRAGYDALVKASFTSEFEHEKRLAELKATNPTPAELGEQAGKAEAVESIRVRILRVIVEYGAVIDQQLYEKMPAIQEWAIVNILLVLKGEGLINRSDIMWKITQAGRDYLAGCEVVAPEDFKSDIYADEDYGDWGEGGLFD